MNECPRVENKIESLPFQEWHPIIDLFRKAPNKRQFMDAMKKGGINIDGENITPIDFFATNPGLSNVEICEAIEGYLGIESLENKIEMVNQSLKKAKVYIEDYLHMGLPKEIKNLKEVESIADIIKIFKKTAAVKNGDGIGLSPAYCALISVAVAVFELQKKEMSGLMKESEYLYKTLFDVDVNTEIKSFHYLKKEKSGYDKVAVYDDIKYKVLICSSYFRGKNEDSLISKFINKPEATAEEAAKDGIGFKLEVKSIEDVKSIIPVIARYFKDHFEAENFIFENTGLLDFDEINEIKLGESEQLSDHKSESICIKEDYNAYSNKNFKAFKINGQLTVPMKGDVNGMKMRRQFEIQIVLANNDNETGFSNHIIYEAAKKLSVVTRLAGSFTEDYLEIICNEASEESGISAEKIRKYMKDNFLIEIDGNGSNIKKYASKKNVKRFLTAGIFAEDYIKKKRIKKARN